MDYVKTSFLYFLIYLFLYICALKRFTTDGKQEIYLHEGYGKKARRVHTYDIQGVEKQS